MRALPDLPDSLMMLCEVGSTSYGTGLEGHEDEDQAGILIEQPQEVFLLDHGFKTVMQRTAEAGARSQHGDIDRSLYSLRQFLKLAMAGNPSILGMLWAPRYETTLWDAMLRESAHHFVGRHVIPKYRGYMHSQMQRLLGEKGSGGHGVRGSGGRVELIEQFGFDTKFAMHAARLGFQCVELMQHHSLQFPIPQPQRAWLLSLREGRVSFDEFTEACDDLDMKMKSLMGDESVPLTCNREKIAALSERIHRGHWGL